MRLALLLALCAVAGCQTAQQRQARDIERASWACADMGYQPETDGHRACVQNLYIQRQAQRSQAASDATAAGTAILLAPPRAPTQTSCRWFAGNYVCQ